MNTPAAGAPLRPARLGQLFAAAVAALSLLWLPLSIIPILDGMLFVAPVSAVMRDLALLWWLALLPAAALAALAATTAWAVRVAGASAERAALVGWCLLLVPLIWVCAWQALRMAWQWARAVAGFDLVIAQELRALVVLLMVGLLVWALRRLTLRAVVGRLASGLASAWPLAAVVLALGAGAVLLDPPVLLRSAQPVAGLGGAAVGPRPDIIVITIDAVAAADADACNPGSATMPHLARFAAQASCFTRFYAASNFTTPTTSTMETGLLPWTHFATQPDATMLKSTREHTLAAVLGARGWRAHSITDNLLASPRHRGTWPAYASTALAETTLYGNAFRDWTTLFPDTALPRLVATSLAFLGAFDVALHGEHSPYESERTYAKLRTLLSSQAPPGAEPVFVWAQPLPPHSPYLPPPSTKYRLLPRGELETWRELMRDNVDYPPATQPLVDKHRLRYRESLMAADAALGAFLGDLERQGRLDGALVVITSDHGESFEKGFLGHAGPLTHDALIRVPLVVKLPGQKLGQVLHMPVSQADLAPTLLDVVGAPPLPRAEGRSLRDALEGRPLAPAPVYAMTMERQSRFKPLTRGHFVVIDGDDKLTLSLDAASRESRATSLFDLAADPGETHDLAAQRPETVARLRGLLATRLAAAEATRRNAASP